MYSSCGDMRSLVLLHPALTRNRSIQPGVAYRVCPQLSRTLQLIERIVEFPLDRDHQR